MWWVYLQSEYKNKFCVSILGYGFTWPHYLRNLSLSKSCKTVAGRHAAKQNTRKITWSVLCPKMLCNILRRMLNSSVHRLFSEKTVLANWIMHSAICGSVLPKWSHCHTLTKHKCLMFWVTFLVKWNGAYYTKNVIIAFKILISNADSLVLVYHDSQKIKKAVKLIGPVSGNKVLDTFSMIQYTTIRCLCHANIIMPSAIWLELSNSRVAPSQVTKMSLRTPDPLYTHTWRFGHETTPKCVTLFLGSASELCPQSPSEELLHVCLQSNWKNIYLL